MKISEREKRYLKISFIGILVFFIYKLIFAPFVASEKEIREELIAKEKLLNKYQGFLESKGQAQERLDALKGTLNSLEPRLFMGKTTSLAAAELQNLLKTLSNSNEIDVKSTKVLNTEKIERYEKIPVQIIAESHVARLVDFLYAVENHNKILVIPELKLDITNYRYPNKVRATVVVAGFRRLG
jgi:Tfp pilus assembly protein PilO